MELQARKTQAQIAAEAGFRQANMLAMLKSGAAKLPLERVPALARALECDPAILFIMAVEQQGITRSPARWRKYSGHMYSQNEDRLAQGNTRGVQLCRSDN